MKFGQVPDPDGIDFTLPKDHLRTKEILEEKKSKKSHAFMGCVKWIKRI